MKLLKELLEAIKADEMEIIAIVTEWAEKQGYKIRRNTKTSMGFVKGESLIIISIVNRYFYIEFYKGNQDSEPVIEPAKIELSKVTDKVLDDLLKKAASK